VLTAENPFKMPYQHQNMYFSILLYLCYRPSSHSLYSNQTEVIVHLCVNCNSYLCFN